MRTMTWPSLAGRTGRERFTRLAVAIVVGASCVTAALLANGSRADEVTVSANNLRDGWDAGETTGALTPASLHGSGLGELFAAQVDGQVYAQPVIAGHTAIVATEDDWVYGLDAVTGHVAWKRFLPALANPKSPGTTWPASAEDCTDLAPDVGVTGTPVYDPANGLVYMVSKEVPAGHTALTPAYYIHALNAQTGAEQPGWPVLIHGAPTNDPTHPFNSFTELQRPGLLLLGGSVYAGFGSLCDYNPYDGYVVGVNITKRTQTMWTDEAGLTTNMAGIWQGGGGLMSDGPGRIFFASGNGVSPAPGPGSHPPSELAESVVRLGVQPDGSLVAKSFFSPANAAVLDAGDGDLGSGGPVGLPFGTAALAHLLVQGGKKDGLFVLNRDGLGGREQGAGGTDAVVSNADPTLAGEWGHPAAFADTPVLTPGNVAASNDYVYYAGDSDSLRYFKVALGGAGGVTPELTDVANSASIFHFGSGSPVVTSNGTDAATAVVWVTNVLDKAGATEQLQAYPAVPPGGSCSAATPCTVSPIWTSAVLQGAGKFTVAATDSGRVYIGSRGVPSDGTNCPAVPSGDYCGVVYGFGTAPLGGTAPPSFGYVQVGMSSSPVQVTVSNTQASGDVTINSVAAGGPFQVASSFDYTQSGGSPAPTPLPVTLHPGDSLTAEGVTFDPTVPGGAAGSLMFNTNSSTFPVVSVGLSGFGEQSGFFSSSSSVSFTGVPAGTTAQHQVTVTNGEPGAQTLTATGLSAPFGVSGLPSGQVQPGQSVTLTLTYNPRSGSESDNATLTLPNSSISLSGTGVADKSALAPVPAAIKFGSVRLGQRAAGTIDVTNTGNLTATITATAPPAIPFGTPDQIAGGLPVNPGYDLKIPITFTPTSIGPVSGDYQLTWKDVKGTHLLSVPVSGQGIAPSAGTVAAPPPGGGWTFNGSAQMTARNLSLTQLTAGQTGSAVYSVPVPSNGLKATFTASIGGGTGADGLTFALLSTKTKSTALGQAGSQLGFGGLPGVAVTLDTAKDGPGYPSANFAAIATCVRGGKLKFVATSTKVPNLRAGMHVIGVSVSGGTITVTVGGTTYLSKKVALAGQVRLAFTGATSTRTDRHIVSGFAITAGGHRIPGPGGGWSFNGAASTAGSDIALTPGLVPSEAGSVVYSTPLTTAGLKVTFNAQFTGAGGDGLTLALLNPATTTINLLGGSGLQLGLGSKVGVPGVGVVLGTANQEGTTDPPTFIGTTIRTGPSGALEFGPTAKGLGSLTAGTDTVTVSVARSGSLGLVLTVRLNGVEVLQAAEPKLTPTVRLAFTAGSGSPAELQVVRSVAVSAPS